MASFEKYVIPDNAPDIERVRRKRWTIEIGLKHLQDDTEEIHTFTGYNSDGSFARRLTYIFTQLERLLLQQCSKSSSSSVDVSLNRHTFQATQRFWANASAISNQSPSGRLLASQDNENEQDNTLEEKTSFCLIS